MKQDFFVSVLEALVTKRDAKTYLKTFAPPNKDKKLFTAPEKGNKQVAVATSSSSRPTSIQNTVEALRLVQSSRWKNEPISTENPPHIALIKLRAPNAIKDETLTGIAKTLSQLRTLGMLSVVVVEGEVKGEGWKRSALEEATRVANAIDHFGKPGARVVDSAMAVNPHRQAKTCPFSPEQVFVEYEELVMAAMRLGELPVVPSIAYTTDTHASKPILSNDILLALTRSFSGLQLHEKSGKPPADAVKTPRTGIVDRIIVLDPLGGIPASHRPDGVHVFINLEEEFESIKLALELGSSNHRRVARTSERKLSPEVSQRHMKNLELARASLSMLPPTASAIITTPVDAATLAQRQKDELAITGLVGTRRRQNPLIHNLLTDKPIYSPSLPVGRIKWCKNTGLPQPPLTTFAKRGMPLKVFPDPRKTPWSPPAPGFPRLRLTDAHIDLPRLVHLIEDSFNRKLDVQHYLGRVNEMIAGVVIAGEYEGGAILTWEVPLGLRYEEAYATGRLIPYLDKFAVLKRSQGFGGVADIVFSSIVRECLPEGVCWRSRKDNPVNKWYSERSKGTYKLSGIDWTMFWTTQSLGMDGRKFWDYESVCKSIQPSWADKKLVAD